MAHIQLAAIIGRTVRHQQDFRPAFGERLADTHIVPDFLADRNADPDPTEIIGTGNRTLGENTFFVEFTVIRQVYLIAQRDDLAAIQKRHGIVSSRLALSRKTDNDARSAIGGLRRQFFHRFQACFQESRLQHQILRRIA